MFMLLGIRIRILETEARDTEIVRNDSWWMCLEIDVFRKKHPTSPVQFSN